jgi:predicted GNAT family N-acyltransferase
MIRQDLAKMTHAKWTISSADLTDIYRLRYNVMVKDAKVNQFPPTHYCIRNGNEFRDDYDDSPHTKHFLVRNKDGKAVAAHRILNGNHLRFEINTFGWFALDKHAEKTHTNPKNIVEPTRVVACRSIRGQHYTVMMLTASLLQIHDDKYESILGVVNSDALSLIQHYQFFMPSLKRISVEKFGVDEFIQGRSCHAFSLYIGLSNTDRNRFIWTTLLPCAILYKAMYIRDILRSNK